MTDRENKVLYIAEQCRKAGCTLAGAAGVIANIEAESAFNPHNLQDTYERSLGYTDESYTAAVDNGTYGNFTGDAAGYGLAQWTAGDRKAKMLAFHKNRKASIGDFQTQVDFLISEMRGYSKAWSTVTQSNVPHECGYAVCRYYEIPADTENQAQYRGGKAIGWYTWLTQHMGEESSIPEEPQQEPEKDEDGIPVPVTWPPRMIDRNCEGWPEIKLAQAALACHGYSVLVDGIFGAALTAKVNQFQREHGLEADGCIGPKTWAELLKM